jgi:hypothetical protein
MSKRKTFRPWNPEQTLLLPPSPVDWLPENHLVFILLDLAVELDLSVIYAVYQRRDPRRVKAYEPRMMVVLLLYAYCVGLLGLPRCGGQASGLHGSEFTGVDGHLLVVDRAEVANR